MTFDYTKPRGTAEALLKRFGQSATLTQVANSGPDYDPVQTPTDHTITAALFNYMNSAIDGTTITQKDRKVLLSTEGLTVTPEVGDTITVDSDKLNILDVKPLSPGGTVVMYELQARA